MSEPRYDEDFEAWAAPFVMAPINTRVVLRSNALAGDAWGADFRYDEAVLTGSGIKGRLSAAGTTAGLRSFMLAAAVGPLRRLIERFVVPRPGEGATPEQQENGFFDLRFIGRTPDEQVLRTRVTGDRDPGYGSTAKMLGQAGACLALDIPDKDAPGGFWTPATIFGDRLVERLRAHAGLTFERLD